MDMTTLMAQHRARWEVPHHLMKVVLKYPGQAKVNTIVQEILQEYPEYTEIAKEISIINEVDKYERGCRKVGEEEKYKHIRPEQKERLEVLVRSIDQYNKRIMRACFAEPELKNQEEFDAFIENSRQDEWERIEKMLIVLTMPLPEHEINLGLIMRCKSLGIPISKDLTAENMTFQQNQAFERTLENEQMSTNEIIEGIFNGRNNP